MKLRKSRLSKRIIPLLSFFGVGLLGAIVGTVIVSAHGGDVTKIHACVKTSTGTIHIVGANDTCAGNETALDWNIQGVQGAPGPTGMPGPTGVPGVGGSSTNLPPRLTYVTNRQSNTVSIMDPSATPAFSTIRVGNQPRMILKKPNGNRLYIINYNDSGNGTVSVIDTTNNTILATLPVGRQPRSAILNNAGTKLYVANFTDNNLSVIDTTNNTVIATIAVGTLPLLLNITPTDASLYVNNVEQNTIKVIDTTNNTVANTISLNSNSEQFSSFNNSIAPHMVFNISGNQGYVVNGDTGKIFVIDTLNNTILQSINVGQFPSAIAINSTGDQVFVANKQTTSVIDTTSNTVISNINIVGSDLNNMTMNSAGTRLYLINASTAALTVIDTQNNLVTKVVSLGNFPNSITIDSDNTHVYITNSGGDDISVIDTNSYQETIIKTGNYPDGILVP